MKKVIISDTSCLIALERINQLSILHEIYNEITITAEVKSEYGKELPDWFKVEQADDVRVKINLEKQLDSGEASSIALALEIKNCILIIDEKKGRMIAEEMHIKTIGTLKVLLIAKEKGIIKSLKNVIDDLGKNGFRFSAGIVDELFKQAKEK